MSPERLQQQCKKKPWRPGWLGLRADIAILNNLSNNTFNAYAVVIIRKQQKRVKGNSLLVMFYCGDGMCKKECLRQNSCTCSMSFVIMYLVSHLTSMLYANRMEAYSIFQGIYRNYYSHSPKTEGLGSTTSMQHMCLDFLNVHNKVMLGRGFSKSALENVTVLNFCER